MDPKTQGVCPACGHVNELKWALCDECGERLPWAQPKAWKKNVDELSDEQLKALFGQPKRSKVPFFLTPEGKKIAAAVVTLLSVLWWLRG